MCTTGRARRKRAKKIEAAGRKAIVVHCDLRKPDEFERLFRESGEKLGEPHILVNGADIVSTGKQVPDMPIEDWDDEMKTNLYGPFYCCQHFIRERRAAGGKGKIINITLVHQKFRAPARRVTTWRRAP
ncbi:MAG: SDR family oxidoreductase [Dehalococcoidia bacterium]